MRTEEYLIYEADAESMSPEEEEVIDRIGEAVGMAHGSRDTVDAKELLAAFRAELLPERERAGTAERLLREIYDHGYAMEVHLKVKAFLGIEEPLTSYRLEFEVCDPLVVAEMEGRKGRGVWALLGAEEWEALPWAPVSRESTLPGGISAHYESLRRWAETHEHPIRKVRFLKRSALDWEEVA